MPMEQPSLSSGIMASQQMKPRGGAYFLPNPNYVTPRGGYREPQNLTTDYTSVLEPIKGMYSDRLDEVVSAPGS